MVNVVCDHITDSRKQDTIKELYAENIMVVVNSAQKGNRILRKGQKRLETFKLTKHMVKKLATNRGRCYLSYVDRITLSQCPSKHNLQKCFINSPCHT